VKVRHDARFLIGGITDNEGDFDGVCLTL